MDESVQANARNIAYDALSPLEACPPDRFLRANCNSGPRNRFLIDRGSLHQEIGAQAELVLPASEGLRFEMETDMREMNSIVFRRVINDSNISDSVPLEHEEVEYLSLSMNGDDEQVVTMRPSVKEIERSTSPVTEFPPWAQEAPPWARKGVDGGISVRSPLLELHQEIVDFCEFVSPTQEEHQLRTAAVQRVTKVIKSIWAQCQVKVFGSFATGLYLPTSDIDVVILDSGCGETQSGLKALGKALTKEAIAKKLQVIGKARVPIVKFVERESLISFDISFDLQSGPEAAEFIKDALNAVPPLKPLCLVLKIFLQQRELNEVYTGGLGSYALLVMLLTHLQTHPSRLSYNSSSNESSALEHNLGVLLVDFFDLYGRALNVKDIGISCRDGGRFFKKISRGFLDTKKPHLLAVEDPQTPDSDIGRNSFNFQKIRFAFMLAHRLLTTVGAVEAQMQAGLLARIVRVDEKLAGRKTLISWLKHEQGSSSLLQLPRTVNRHGSDGGQMIPHQQENQQRRDLVYEEHEFPRGGVDEEHFKRGTKRKRAKRWSNDREQDKLPEERIHKRNKQSKHNRSWLKGKRKEGDDVKTLNNPRNAPTTLNQDQAGVGPGWKHDRMVDEGDFALNLIHFPVQSKEEISIQRRKQGLQWYDESKRKSGWSDIKPLKRVNVAKGQGYKGPDRVLGGRDRPVSSVTRRLIATSAHRKTKYL